jgi:hypothetical protein
LARSALACAGAAGIRAEAPARVIIGERLAAFGASSAGTLVEVAPHDVDARFQSWQGYGPGSPDLMD